MIQINVQVTKAQRDSLVALGKASGTKASDLIRQAVVEFLAKAKAEREAQAERPRQK